MSHLKLFAPDLGEDHDVLVSFEQPVVLSFRAAFHSRTKSTRQSPGVSRLLGRARTLHQNRCCPGCKHPVVEPLDLENGIRGRNGRPIPGTSSLIGFRCDRCSLEWPA